MLTSHRTILRECGCLQEKTPAGQPLLAELYMYLRTTRGIQHNQLRSDLANVFLFLIFFPELVIACCCCDVGPSVFKPKHRIVYWNYVSFRKIISKTEKTLHSLSSFPFPSRAKCCGEKFALASIPHSPGTASLQIDPGQPFPALPNLVFQIVVLKNSSVWAWRRL